LCHLHAALINAEKAHQPIRLALIKSVHVLSANKWDVFTKAVSEHFDQILMMLAFSPAIFQIFKQHQDDCEKKSTSKFFIFRSFQKCQGFYEKYQSIRDEFRLL